MKESILAKAARKLDVPGEILAGLPKVEITGCREIYIGNHKGLLLYERNDIHINGNGAVIKLKGEDFIIKAMSGAEIRIEGWVYGIEFDYE